jgi:hypothetical protein
VPTVWKSGSLNLLEPSRLLQVYIGIVLPVKFAEAEVEVAEVM